MGEREGVLTGTLQAPGLAPRGTPSGHLGSSVGSDLSHGMHPLSSLRTRSSHAFMSCRGCHGRCPGRRDPRRAAHLAGPSGQRTRSRRHISPPRLPWPEGFLRLWPKVRAAGGTTFEGPIPGDREPLGANHGSRCREPWSWATSWIQAPSRSSGSRYRPPSCALS